MKKLIMFVMVIMLCMGTAAKADPVASWDFDGTLADCSGNGYNASMYAGAEEYDCEGPPPGGCAIELDGTNSVELPLGAANPLDHTADWSIAMWFKVPEMAAGEGAMLLSSSIDNEGDNHSYALFLESGEVAGQGALRVDMFYISAVVGDTVDLDDGTWHHVAVTFVESTAMTTLYLDGVEDGSDPMEGTIPNIADNTILIGDTLNTEFPAEVDVGPQDMSIAHVALFAEALDLAGVAEAMNDGFPCSGPKNPIVIDPNVMLVYETDTTQGDFVVSLKFPPRGQGSPGNPDGTPITVNIIVDPNGYDGGGSSDITLIGNDGPPHYRVTFTRTIANWDTPEVILFKAKDDELAEPPTLDEAQNIVVWAEPVATTEPNWSRPVAQKVAGGVVWDNDQANILFRKTGPRGTLGKTPVIGPVKLWEQEIPAGIQWRKIFFKLQVQPSGGPVKLNAVVEGEVEGDNLPHTDPCLPLEEADDPNRFTFTSTTSTGETGLPKDCPDWNTTTKTSCWDVEQPIMIWGVDDAVLQALEAAAEGDQNYRATLVVTVLDGGGDERYEWLEEVLDGEGEPLDPPEFVLVGLEKVVEFDIEDNECGAFGLLAMDIGNPNAATDPNYVDDDGNPLPDCHVDMNDAIEIVSRWLDCTDPQGEGCVQLNL